LRVTAQQIKGEPVDGRGEDTGPLIYTVVIRPKWERSSSAVRNAVRLLNGVAYGHPSNYAWMLCVHKWDRRGPLEDEKRGKDKRDTASMEWLHRRMSKSFKIG
jgi:hypothetical protein